MMISTRIEHILQQFIPYGSKKPLLIGVSGGPDSLCLLDVLFHLDFPLVIAHLNHGLRAEADSDAEMVSQAAADLGVKLVMGKEDVPGYARSHKLSIEEAARLLRYRFLFSQAVLVHAQAVVVAHTADDQVETVLMHLLRGAGLSGLIGMSYYSLPNSWSQEIPLIRPLLGCWRGEILDYCQEHALHPVLDKSNQDESYTRNHLRHALIPYLETYNPQVRKALWNTSQALAGDYEIIEGAVASAWGECLRIEAPGFVGFRRSSLMRQTVGTQRRLVRLGIDRVRPGLRDIDFGTIDRALEFIKNPVQTSFTDLAGGLYLLLEGDNLWLAVEGSDLPDFEWPQMPVGVEIRLDIPGAAELLNGWRLQAELVEDRDASPPYNSNQDPFQAWLDGGCIKTPLVIRRRRPGDRFQRLGMTDHTTKLSDLMINARIPYRARAAWPLVCSEEEIVWIPGNDISQRVRVSDNTHQIVRLQLVRTKDKRSNPN